MTHPLEEYTMLYPQLSLPIREGMSQSEEYKNIVKRGVLPKDPKVPFACSPEDRVFTVETPVGTIPVLQICCRADFVRFIQAISHRCEPVPVPDSMGAVTYFGLTNWHKIQQHKMAYLLSGSTDWAQEFRRFTADPKNYKDTVLVVSQGPYSALPAERAGLSQEDWIRASLTIRTWHELTHLISRTLYPENKHALRDELMADCIGLLAAFGRFPRDLAADLLGITPQGYRQGGRLQNYLSETDSLEDVISRADRMLDLLAEEAAQAPGKPPFEFLMDLEQRQAGMDLWK